MFRMMESSLNHFRRRVDQTGLYYGSNTVQHDVFCHTNRCFSYDCDASVPPCYIMPDERPPKCFVCESAPNVPNERHKHPKSLAECVSWEQTAQGRGKCPCLIRKGHISMNQRQSVKLKKSYRTPRDDDQSCYSRFACFSCNRHFRATIGLNSHKRTHNHNEHIVFKIKN